VISCVEGGGAGDEGRGSGEETERDEKSEVGGGGGRRGEEVMSCERLPGEIKWAR